MNSATQSAMSHFIQSPLSQSDVAKLYRLPYSASMCISSALCSTASLL